MDDEFWIGGPPSRFADTAQQGGVSFFLRFATVAYPGYTIVFPYWSKRYRAGVLRFATVAYPGYTIVFPYWSKRYRAGV